MTKKFLSLLLAVVMVCAMGIPVSATETVVWTEVDTANALLEAFAEGGNIKLKADITLTTPTASRPNAAAIIPEGKTVTLDLNGCDINVGTRTGDTSKHLYAIDNYGTLTLTDSEGEGVITARGIENFGTMIVNNGKIISCDANGGAAIWNEGDLTVNGGTFTTGTGSTTDSGPGALNNQPDAKATLNGGNFIGNSPRVYAIITEGDMTINNATVSGKHGALSVYGGKTVVKDGTFTRVDGSATSGHVIYTNTDNGIVEIQGGTFDQQTATSNGYVIFLGGKTKITVTGGEFKASGSKASGGVYTATTSTDTSAFEGALEINGGTFDEDCSINMSAPDSTLKISGGTFAGKLTVSNSASFTVTGGKFTDDAAKALIDEKKPSNVEIGTDGTVRQKFTATFKANGKTVGDPVTYYFGDKAIAEPAVPAKEGYYGYWAAYKLNGTIEVNAIYVKIVERARVSFVADGKLVGIILYRPSQDALTALPKVPAKEGYVGTWAEYTLTGKNMIVRAVYTPIAE